MKTSDGNDKRPDLCDELFDVLLLHLGQPLEQVRVGLIKILAPVPHLVQLGHELGDLR